MTPLYYLSLLPSAALAFQQQVGIMQSFHLHRTTVLHTLPNNFERAQHCATHYGSCSLEEMEELASELEHFQSHMGGADGMPSVFRDGSEFWSGPVQGGMDDGNDTKMISDMLRKQSELLHMMEDYVEDHHKPDTFDMSDV